MRRAAGSAPLTEADLAAGVEEREVEGGAGREGWFRMVGEAKSTQRAA